MTIEFKPMSEEKFSQYSDRMAVDYAGEHVKAGNWSEHEAVDKAKKQLEQTLPDGLETKGHFLFSVCNDDEPIGVLWLNVRPTLHGNDAFIYDIRLDDNQQGKGLGKAAMQELDRYAEQHGIQKIALHVFAHNDRAFELYKKMGYEMTNIQMAKVFPIYAQQRRVGTVTNSNKREVEGVERYEDK
ncbi:GNAT family N-acetyltransferase [Virgibacillus ihumii]|uniref:GNAT family N-acetyltransferase n=1 Tax=Virgibacillus ihumii TaxID=2686091 RepID=UPI00157E1BDF|nr:GNAT family N-acetyltransferase [Virgibacillus ihumii]